MFARYLTPAAFAPVALLVAFTSAAIADQAEEPRFLDDQQITCTGESSVVGYTGPCGSSIG